MLYLRVCSCLLLVLTAVDIIILAMIRRDQHVFTWLVNLIL